MPAPLDGIRVVDRTDAGAELCGRILADLGAEVIKVEPPSGCDARRRPPFDHDSGASLWWRAFGRGKRSVVVDADDPDDRRRIDRLLAGADVVIESADGDAVDALAASARDLADAHPSLVVSCITPYGLDGPRAAWPATDLTVEAASGRLMLQGDRDRPPVPLGFPQSGCQGAGAAVSDIVIALYERERSGQGQVLDTSAQIAVTWTLMNATGYGAVTDDDPSSTDERRLDPRPELSPGVAFPGVEQVADGWVNITPPLLGQVTIDSFSTLIDWVAEDGLLPEDLRDRRWGTFLTDMRTGEAARDDAGRMVTALRAWLAAQPKAELHRRAVEARVLVAPVTTGADLLADPQLAARAFWTDQDGVPEAGPWAWLSATPLVDPTPAPALGADQALLDRMRAPAVPAAPDRPGRGPVFAGLRVADLTWAGVGPFMSKALADQGATTVKVESASKPDQMRMVPPYRDDAPPLENTHAAPNFNTNKLSLGVDLSTGAGRDIVHRLVGWADVVIENMTPGALDRLGIGYADLAGGRDDLIMLSTSLRGQTGPERTYTGFGQQGAALSGFWSITGWSDRAPAGPWGPYTDFVAPRVGIAALAAAIRHRYRTGQGQWIDLAQIEATVQFLEPVVLDQAVNHVTWPAMGHDSPYDHPHGVYPAAEPARFVAASCHTDGQRQALRELLGEQGEPRDLDGAVRAWIADRPAADAVDGLVAAGVPAALVARPTDLHADPQLAHRRFFVELDHPTLGRTRFDGPATRLSATPSMLFSPGPTIGQHTDEVLADLLGYDEAEIARFEQDQVLR